LADSLAVSLHLDNFILQGDSSIVILALQNPSNVLDRQIEHVICDTLSLFPTSCLWEVRKVNRNINFCNQHVAYKAVVKVIMLYWAAFLSSLFHPYFFLLVRVLFLFSFVVKWFVKKNTKKQKLMMWPT
jgi:hypothetical protein